MELAKLWLYGGEINEDLFEKILKQFSDYDLKKNVYRLSIR